MFNPGLTLDATSLSHTVRASLLRKQSLDIDNPSNHTEVWSIQLQGNFIASPKVASLETNVQ